MTWRLRTSKIRKQIAQLDPATDHAQIVALYTGHEFLWDSIRSLELALFRTFASPSISALLDRTRQFRDEGQKRYDDTSLLILAIIRHGYDSHEGKQAIAQMNAIHGRYRIANDDLLFVLSTFVLDPIRWNERFGWRQLTAAEKESLFLVWMNIGQRMEIADVPETLDEMQRESDAYVRAKFEYAPSNARVAEATLAIMQAWLPRALRSRVKPAACALLDEATLAAFRFERPSWAFRQGIERALKARAAALRVIDDAPVPAWPEGRRTYPAGYRLDGIGPTALLAAIHADKAATADAFGSSSADE